MNPLIIDPNSQTKAPPPINITINPSDTKPMTCPCGCEVFAQGFLLRKLSVFLGGNNMPGRLPIVYCVKCFKVVPDFLPNELKSDFVDV